MKFVEGYLSWVLTAIGFVVLLFIASSLESVNGGADSYQHYLISHEAFEHPENFFHHWGKPFFTLLSSPFTAFGWFGMLVFNALVVALSGWFMSALLKALQVKFHWLAVPLVIALPILFETAFSGLTEPLFALVVAAALWLLAKERWIWSAALISFLPLVRTEGFLIVGLFVLAIAVLRQWRSIPWTFFGFAVYSLIGGLLVHDDFLWIIRQNPYATNALYGNGTWDHYLMAFPQLYGWGTTALVAVGAPLLFLVQFRKRTSTQKVVIALAFLAFATYFAAHSYVWWKGQGASLGLMRIMASVAPLLVLPVLYVVHSTSIWKHWLVYLMAPAVLSLASLPFFFEEVTIPRQQNFEEQALQRAGDWLKANADKSDVVGFYNPALCVFTDRDLFDASQTAWMNAASTEKIPEGYIAWDSHFGPGEGGTDFERLFFDQRSELVHIAEPDGMHRNVWGHHHAMYLFKFHAAHVKHFDTQHVLKTTFDQPHDSTWRFGTERYNDVHGYNHTISYKMDAQNPFMEWMNQAYAIPDSKTLYYAHAEGQFWAPDLSALDSALLVISVDKDGELLHYRTQAIGQELGEDQWVKQSISSLLPVNIPSGCVVKMYLWNQGGKEFYVENVSLNMITVKSDYPNSPEVLEQLFRLQQ